MSLTPNEYKRALLVATVDSLEVPYVLGYAIASATTATRQNLVIVLFSPLFNRTMKLSRTKHWSDIQAFLTYVYVQATKVAQSMDKILMDIDVLLMSEGDVLPHQILSSIDVCYSVLPGTNSVPALNIGRLVKQITLQPHRSQAQSITPSEHYMYSSDEEGASSTLPVVALGGTFDHLHAGHKILLSMAAWMASEKVIVGVTDDELLRNKSNKHALESITTRKERTYAFLKLFRPDLVYDVVAINDVYGPTAWDPNIQALVVSKETLPGATSIDKERSSKSLPLLKTFVIDVISSTSERVEHEDIELLKQAKMSSTFIRQWIVDKGLQDSTT